MSLSGFRMRPTVCKGIGTVVWASGLLGIARRLGSLQETGTLYVKNGVQIRNLLGNMETTIISSYRSLLHNVTREGRES